MKKTIAIVSVYYPKIEHVNNVRLISEQVDKVIVCDNSDFDNSDIFSGISNLFYRGYKKNNGLSTAFNIVLNDSNFEWNDDDFIICFLGKTES